MDLVEGEISQNDGIHVRVTYVADSKMHRRDDGTRGNSKKTQQCEINCSLTRYSFQHESERCNMLSFCNDNISRMPDPDAPSVTAVTTISEQKIK